MADLDSEFASVEQIKDAKDKALDENLRRQQADDRSHIAKVIVWAFVVFMAIVIAAAIGGTFLYDWDDIAEPGKFLMAILSSVMLPVVTLVLGYYFGKER